MIDLIHDYTQQHTKGYTMHQYIIKRTDNEIERCLYLSQLDLVLRNEQVDRLIDVYVTTPSLQTFRDFFSEVAMIRNELVIVDDTDCTDREIAIRNILRATY